MTWAAITRNIIFLLVSGCQVMPFVYIVQHPPQCLNGFSKHTTGTSKSASFLKFPPNTLTTWKMEETFKQEMFLRLLQDVRRQQKPSDVAVVYNLKVLSVTCSPDSVGIRRWILSYQRNKSWGKVTCAALPAAHSQRRKSKMRQFYFKTQQNSQRELRLNSKDAASKT